MLIKILIIAAVLLSFAGIIYLVKIKRFKPNPNKAEQEAELNALLAAAGFAYDRRYDHFYSLKDCWQRETGYCRLYDEGSTSFNMVMDCEPIEFEYGTKRWLIELWKGQYGITTGAEIGIYNTDREDVSTEKFTGTFYDAASDSEQMDMSFILYKNGKKLLKRKEHNWWLTAFKLGEFSDKDELSMIAKIKFPNAVMRSRFVKALLKIGYTEKQFGVFRNTVKIRFIKPHTEQPITQTGIQADTAQHMNKVNCTAYNAATARYTDTLDKLEYLKSFAPTLFDFMINSLYGKAFYKAFEWLFDLIHGDRPPEPKPPYPPKPPCRTCPPCRTDNICRECCRRRCEDRINCHKTED